MPKSEAAIATALACLRMPLLENLIEPRLTIEFVAFLLDAEIEVSALVSALFIGTGIIWIVTATTTFAIVKFVVGLIQALGQSVVVAVRHGCELRDCFTCGERTAWPDQRKKKGRGKMLFHDQSPNMRELYIRTRRRLRCYPYLLFLVLREANKIISITAFTPNFKSLCHDYIGKDLH